MGYKLNRLADCVGSHGAAAAPHHGMTHPDILAWNLRKKVSLGWPVPPPTLATHWLQSRVFTLRTGKSSLVFDHLLAVPVICRFHSPPKFSKQKKPSTRSGQPKKLVVPTPFFLCKPTFGSFDCAAVRAAFFIRLV